MTEASNRPPNLRRRRSFVFIGDLRPDELKSASPKPTCSIRAWRCTLRHQPCRECQARRAENRHRVHYQVRRGCAHVRTATPRRSCPPGMGGHDSSPASSDIWLAMWKTGSVSALDSRSRSTGSSPNASPGEDEGQDDQRPCAGPCARRQNSGSSSPRFYDSPSFNRISLSLEARSAARSQRSIGNPWQSRARSGPILLLRLISRTAMHTAARTHCRGRVASSTSETRKKIFGRFRMRKFQCRWLQPSNPAQRVCGAVVAKAGVMKKRGTYLVDGRLLWFIKTAVESERSDDESKALDESPLAWGPWPSRGSVEKARFEILVS